MARLAAGAVLAACDAVLTSTVRRAFCAVRPPGHHAESDRAMGFCVFNNIAIAAEYAIRRHGLRRVAIVDFDVHHGNGTQHAFENRDDVLFISLHEDPRHLFPFSGFACETGHDRGHGYTLNVPLPPGSDDASYRAAFFEKVIPALMRFNPQLVLVSAGFDASACEEIADMDLTEESYEWMTQALVKVADGCCAGRLISVLEGGYDLPSLQRSVIAHVAALM